MGGGEEWGGQGGDQGGDGLRGRTPSRTPFALSSACVATDVPCKNRWEIERSIQLVGIERKPKRARSPWLLQVASAAEVASALVAKGRLDRV